VVVEQTIATGNGASITVPLQVWDPVHPAGSPVDEAVLKWSVIRIAVPAVLVLPGIAAVPVMSAPASQAAGFGGLGLQTGVGGVLLEFVPEVSPVV
jgi:hypothetical protein